MYVMKLQELDIEKKIHNSGIPKSIEHIIKTIKNQFQFYYHKILTLFRWQGLKINLIHGFVKIVFICLTNDFIVKINIFVY